MVGQPGRSEVPLVVVLLIGLNVMLLWRDYQKGQGLEEIQLRLHNTEIELRISQSTNLFGAPFIPIFDTVDLQGQDSVLPYFGMQDMLILFFKPGDCGNCLQNLSLFKATIGKNVPVVSIAQSSSISEVKQSVEGFVYEFPIYVAKDMPFKQMRSVYCTFINKNRNVVFLSRIDPSPDSVFETIRDLEQLIALRNSL